LFYIPWQNAEDALKSAAEKKVMICEICDSEDNQQFKDKE